MNKKEENAKKVKYLREVNEERKKINKKLDNELTNIVKNNESLSNYELWINKKCEIMIQPKYIIEKIQKNLEEEGFGPDTVYVIIKKLQKRKRGRMMSINYEKIIIEDILSLSKTNYISEIVCDADNKAISVKKEECLKIANQLKDYFKPVIDTICEIGKKICDIFNSILDNFKYMLNKKMSKKRFTKLLQSEGIQRNAINEIVKNNIKPYTYARYYQILIKFSKDERKEKFYV